VKRRLLNLLTVLSLLLCVAVVALWVLSYVSSRQWVAGSHPGIKWEVSSARGWLTVDRNHILFWPSFRNGNLWSMRAEGRYSPGHENAAGIYLHRDEGLVRPRLPGEERPPLLPALERKLPKQTWYYQSKVGVAYRLLFLVTLLPPAIWLWERRRWVRRRRIEAGLCRGCGYDLRATPGRCPECGHVIDGAPSTG
jgi:hypothetical protein